MTILDVVRREGLAVMPDPMPSAQVAAFNRFLSEKQIWEGHVPAKSGGRVGDKAHSPSTCWLMEDVLAAPYLFEMALSLFPMASEYLEQPALLYSVNAFTTYPREGPTVADIQEFHRDRDDSKFIGLFMFCSDVPALEDGGHEFVRGSHLDGSQGHEGREILDVTGPAGTMFLAVTSGLHRGIRPRSLPRTMAWARWGVSDPPAAYSWDSMSPVASAKLGARYPTDPAIRSGLRLVIREEGET